jgi:hypothetical protein
MSMWDGCNASLTGHNQPGHLANGHLRSSNFEASQHLMREAVLPATYR